MAETFPSPALQHGEEKQGISWVLASLYLTEEPPAFFKSLCLTITAKKVVAFYM